MKIFLLIFFATHSVFSFENNLGDGLLSRSSICKSSYCEFETTETIDYQFAFISEKLEFKVRAAKDVYIIATSELSVLEPLVKICIGCDDNKISTINPSKSKSKKFLTKTNTENILNADEYRGFWVSFINNVLLVGRQNENDPFLAWLAPEKAQINYLGLHTHTGKGSWILGDDKCWVPGDKEKMPEKALKGGVDLDDSALYIARVRYNDYCEIGTVSPKYDSVTISNESKGTVTNRYEVLIAKKGQWKRFNDGMKRKDLLGATNAGQRGSKPIRYVARMKVQNRFIPGYFNYEQGKCFSSYGGRPVEVKATECEILFSTC